MTGVALIWLATALLLAVGSAALSRWLTFRDTRNAARNGALLDPATADAVDRDRPRPWVVFNPSKFADPDDFRAKVNDLALQHGISHVHWRGTTPEDPGTGQTVRALAEGASVVIAAGGDGTVRAVAAGIAHAGVRMGIIPVGTGNLLARNLGLPLDDLPRAVAVALGPDHRSVDLAWLRVEDVEEASDIPAEGGLLAAADAASVRALPEGVPEPRRDEYAYVIIAGLGFDGETMANTDPKLKKSVGWPAYVLSALTALRTRRMRCRLTLHDPLGPGDQETPALGHDLGERSGAVHTTDTHVHDSTTPGEGTPVGSPDETTEFTARTVLFANCGELPYIVLAPDADPDDGLLDIIAVDTQAGLLGWADLAAKVLVQGAGLRPLDMPTSTGQIAFRQAPAASVHVDRPQVVQVDGDALGRARTVHVRVEAGALDIAVA
ncbi:diacylglycerol kinase family protein [Actinomyces sp.]|uniref:diacylglycerol/lipid kinase family protein n=1 Tax=Actinomyces sp. TaxID=29317 RepID=UPI00289708BC|nr:diacylglycerol kinase family protein [Actinomyces sp.]